MKLWLSFLHLVPIVENFIRKKTIEYHIDYSHNIHHSWRVKELGFLIAHNDYHLTKKQEEVLYLSCMLHDMCDPKYTPMVQTILDISRFLKEECAVPMMTHDGVMNIITSMSYRKIVQPDGKIQFPCWLHRERNFQNVYHITREADLLSSYDLKRMIHYKREKLGMLYSSDIYKDVLETIDQRMSRLLERKLFHSPTAQKIAKEWHHELCHEILPTFTQDDVYPLFNQELETMEMFKQRIEKFQE